MVVADGDAGERVPDVLIAGDEPDRRCDRVVVKHLHPLLVLHIQGAAGVAADLVLEIGADAVHVPADADAVVGPRLGKATGEEGDAAVAGDRVGLLGRPAGAAEDTEAAERHATLELRGDLLRGIGHIEILRGVGDQKAAARGIVDRQASRFGAAEEIADGLGDLPGGESAVGVGEVELVLIRPIEGRAELAREAGDLVGRHRGEVEVHPVEGIRGEILRAAVGVEDTAGEGEPLARGPHAEGGPGGGVVEVRRDRILVEGEVREIELGAVAEQRLVGDEDIADLADEDARLFAQALNEEILAREHR